MKESIVRAMRPAFYTYLKGLNSDFKKALEIYKFNYIGVELEFQEISIELSETRGEIGRFWDFIEDNLSQDEVFYKTEGSFTHMLRTCFGTRSQQTYPTYKKRLKTIELYKKFKINKEVKWAIR